MVGGRWGKVGSSELLGLFCCEDTGLTQVQITRTESVDGLPGAWGESGGSQNGCSYIAPASPVVTLSRMSPSESCFGYTCTERNQVSQRRVYLIDRDAFQSLGASVLLPQGQAHV